MTSIARVPMDGMTFGCDPELFIRNDKSEYVSAEGLIPGTKEEPYKVEGGAVQVDGMAAEFNTDPASTWEEFNDNVLKVIKQLKGFLPTGHSLVIEPNVTFSEKVWDAASDKAKELGCMPDFNAWSGDINKVPECLELPRMRTASGHLHIGWTQDASMSDAEHIKNCRDLVKQFDWFLGGWSLQKDPDPIRRRLYGRAGACRYKSYGVEYRVLSNFWLKSTTTRMQVWNRMQEAIWSMAVDYLPEKAKKNSSFLIESINNSERNPALERSYVFPLLKIDGV